MWYKNTVEYSTAFKKKEILSLETTWTDKLEDIMQSEISQDRKTSTTWSYLSVKSKQVSLTESRMVVSKNRGQEEEQGKRRCWLKGKKFHLDWGSEVPNLTPPAR